jgi:hypothetical protein
MKIDSQEIRIVPATEDLGGNKLEPEERPAEIRYGMSLPLTLGTGPTQRTEGAPIHQVRGLATVDMTAGELANSMRKRCGDCVYFDRNGWRKLYKEWKVGTYEQQQNLNTLREAAERVDDDAFRAKHMDQEQGEVDTDHVLADMGICQALTDYWSAILKKREEMLFMPECGCPDQFGPDGAYLGFLFKPRDASAEKRGSKVFDNVMNMAQGRTHVVKPEKK